ILPFVLAFCIVSALNPVIRFVTGKLKLSHSAASISVMVIIYGLAGFLLFRLIMLIFYFMRDVFTQLPGYFDTSVVPVVRRVGESLMSLSDRLPVSDAWLGELESGIMNAIQSFLVSVSQSGLGYVTAFTGRIPSFMVGFLFTIMLSFFIGIRYEEVTAFMKDQLPAKLMIMAGELRGIIGDIARRYFSALLKLMVITFVELAIGLTVLRVPNALLTALGVAVLDALPAFGTGTVLIPWALIELVQGNYAFAAGLAILYVIITVVRNIIEPHIVGQKLGLNPVAALVAIYLGFRTMGILGMIVMPMAVQILIELHRKGIIILPGARNNANKG
ncbi:MAG: sporulation integral membrane protein YtvI, partial [Oscillospiraceae bacterium]|nr:sporulation integral membrane protein YtvI [Oscillospiraceae bacterium]